MGGLMAVLFTVLVPGMIAAQIAEGRGIPPFIGFVVGAVWSWPGMVFFAIASGMVHNGHSSNRRRRRAHPAGYAKPLPTPAPLTRPTARRSAQPARPAMSTGTGGRATSAAEARRALDAQRRRRAELEHEAELLRRSAESDRRRFDAELAKRDGRLATREEQIELLRERLAAAETEREEAKLALDPWYGEHLAAAGDVLPDVLPADIPRHRFDEDELAAEQAAREVPVATGHADGASTDAVEPLSAASDGDVQPDTAPVAEPVVTEPVARPPAVEQPKVRSAGGAS